MKALIVGVVIGTVSFSAISQLVIGRHTPGASNQLDTMDFSAPPQAAPAPVIPVLDPYRMLNGIPQKVDNTWVTISGTVDRVEPDGSVWVRGAVDSVPQSFPFRILEFPYQEADGDRLPPRGFLLAAHDAGTCTDNLHGSGRTYHQYDYGIRWDPSAQQAAARKADIDARTKAAAAATLKANQDACATGDAYGQLRMAERYRDGDGVAKDSAKAESLFTLSAGQCDETAAKELAAMTNAVSVAGK